MLKNYRRAHKSESIWQILFPLILSFILISSLGFLIFSNPSGKLDHFRLWADISILFISIPILQFLILLILFLLFSIIGVSKLSLLIHKHRLQFQESFQKYIKIPSNIASAFSRLFLSIGLAFRIPKAFVEHKGKNYE